MIGRDIGKALTVEEAVGQLSAAYVALISSGAPLGCFPSVMLWGAPSVGKSQGVRQIAQKISEGTGKTVHITDVRLLLFNPVDLRGIPTANAEKTLAVWLKPRIFQMDESSEVINILLLDEISAAPPSVQAAAYQLTLDRAIGEHRLPDNCIVIAAGNRVTDRSVVFAMPKALANRLCHIEIAGDADAWHRWAVGAGIHHIVLGFLAHSPHMLMRFDPSSDALSFPTPRSWEMVSHILNRVSEDIREVYPLIVGCVGEEAAYELRAFSDIYGKIPSMDDVFAGKESPVPTRPEALLALASQFAPYAAAHTDEAGIDNAVQYAQRLPIEFRNRIFADLLEVPAIRQKLSRIPTFDYWFARSGREWEDYGI